MNCVRNEPTTTLTFFTISKSGLLEIDSACLILFIDDAEVSVKMSY
jgi:hypothetical protein